MQIKPKHKLKTWGFRPHHMIKIGQDKHIFTNITILGEHFYLDIEYHRSKKWTEFWINNHEDPSSSIMKSLLITSRDEKAFQSLDESILWLENYLYSIDYKFIVTPM